MIIDYRLELILLQPQYNRLKARREAMSKLDPSQTSNFSIMLLMEFQLTAD